MMMNIIIICTIIFLSSLSLFTRGTHGPSRFKYVGILFYGSLVFFDTVIDAESAVNRLYVYFLCWLHLSGQ